MNGGAGVAEDPQRRPRRRSAVAAPQLGAVVALGALPGVLLADVIDGSASVVIGVVVPLLAVVTMGVVSTALRRWTAWTHPLALVAVGVVGGGIAAVAVAAAWPGPAADRRAPVAAAADGVVHGWSALVTSPVPTAAEPRMLVPLAVLLWLVASLATVLVLRTDAPVAPLAPGAAALILASVAAGSSHAAPVGVGLAFVLAAGVLLAARSTRVTGGGRRQPGEYVAALRSAAVVAGSIVAATALVAVVAGPSLTFGRDEDPFDPRDHLDPPVDTTSAVSPLELVASRLQRPDVPMFTVRSGEPVDTRLVALDTFDGARWSSTGGYGRAGRELPRPERTDVAWREIHVEITVDELTGPWLPSVGDPTRVSGTPVMVDPAAGSVIAAGGGDDREVSYVLDAAVPVPDVHRLQNLPVADDAEAMAALTLPPGLPDELRDVAAEATAGATTPLLQAVLLERYLRLTYSVDTDAGAGHSYGHLLRALTVEHVGTSEQFATAFAVLGRIVGLPTRVVVGFGPGESTGDDTYLVRSGDVMVWPEVRFRGVGWVAFDPTPTPDGGTDGGTVPVGSGSGGETDSPDGDDDELEMIGGDDRSTDRPTEAEVVGGGSGRPWLQGLVAAILVVVCALPIAVYLAKRRRTRRRRAAADARRQVIGAWHDVLDRLTERDGANRTACRTVKEIVTETDAGMDALTGLYRPVNRALYGDDDLTGDDALQAWRARDRFVESLHRTGGWGRRMRCAVDPRPMLRSDRRIRR